MFEIKVTGISMAPVLKNSFATKTISLMDPGVNFDFNDPSVQGAEDHLVRRFYDVDSETDPDGPKKEVMAEILEFSKSFKEDDKIFVHCHAGVSRSTATAIAVLLQHGMEPLSAIQHIQSIRPCLWPNSLMIMYYDELLGLDGKLSEIIGKWKKDSLLGLKTFNPKPPSKSVDDIKELMKKLNSFM